MGETGLFGCLQQFTVQNVLHPNADIPD